MVNIDTCSPSQPLKLHVFTVFLVRGGKFESNLKNCVQNNGKCHKHRRSSGERGFALAWGDKDTIILLCALVVYMVFECPRSS